ncbi:MAG: hemerythrin domain-containing protein [Candidatus Paceibacterota bacterium]|jgi:hemerythrin superfamily protein|nr:hemerythrin domain-containing protein [Candidatus Paceibacterota bacterium]
MNATRIIKRDHEAARELFNKFKTIGEDKRADVEIKILDALSYHEQMEDIYFYPALKEKLGGSDELMETEIAQKNLASKILAARVFLGDKKERITEIMESLLEHAEKEEKEILSRAEKLFTAIELENLGKLMEPESAVENAGIGGN